MADRSISISLEADVTGFTSGLRTAEQATTTFANRTEEFARNNEQHLNRVGTASMVFGGALLAGVTIAVKAFMEFDSAMSEVQASTHETSANMDLLREAAINAGADTAFSAKEAAKGIDELAKAGVSTKDILGGGLTGALSLAAAGSLGVGEAAEIAATALTQFKLSGDKVPHLADLLAAGAGKAQGSVQDMGMALKQAGLVAASTGLSIEETTGGLAAFASAGLIGSDAGTSFKSMLQRLTPQSKEAKAEMEKLGISAYDAQGQFIGLSKFSENLKTSMADLTPEARNAAMGVIFGSDAVRAANVLYEQGGKGIEDWTAKVNDAGFAAVTASIKQDNLAGDIEKLGGSFDSVLIKGGSGVAESLRGLVQGAEDLVDAFGKIPTPILNAGVGIAGIAGAGLLLGGVLMTALPKLMEFRASMSALATAAPRTATGLSRVGKAAGVAMVAMIALQVVAAVFTEKDTKSAEDYGQALLKVGKAGADGKSGLDGLFTGFDKLGGRNISDINSLSGAIQKLTHQDFNDVANKFVEPITKFLGFPKQEIGQLEDRLNGLGDAMGNLVKNGGAETAAKNFQELTKEFEKNGKGAKEALDSVPGYADALKELATQSGVTLDEQGLLDLAMGKVPDSMKKAAGATETFTNAVGETKPVTEDMAKELEKIGVSAQGTVTILNSFVEVMQRAGLLTLSERDSQRAYADALMNVGLNADGTGAAVGEMGVEFGKATEQGRKNEAMFDAVARAGMSTTQTMADTTDAFGANVYTQEQLQANLVTTYNNLITTAGQFGITGDAATTLARDILKIPANANINTWMSDYALKMAQQTTGELDKLDGRKVTTTIETINRQVNTSEYREDPSMVGLDPSTFAKKATGGRVYGPGSTTSDSIPTMLSKDEYVIKASAAKALGYGYLDKLNGGDTQPLKAGVQYAPASAPARQMVASASTSDAPTQMTGTLVMDSGEVLGVFHGVAVAAAKGVVSSADSNSQRTRAGR